MKLYIVKHPAFYDINPHGDIKGCEGLVGTYLNLEEANLAMYEFNDFDEEDFVETANLDVPWAWIEEYEIKDNEMNFITCHYRKG